MLQKELIILSARAAKTQIIPFTGELYLFIICKKALSCPRDYNGGLTRCSPDTFRMPTILTASGGTGWLLRAASMKEQGLGGGVS